MATQHTNSICTFGAVVLSKHLANLSKEIDGVRNADDIENIHRMRVATRRLRNAFTIFKQCLPRKQSASWLKRIRKVTKSLGASRDLDVQIDLLRTVEREIPDTDPQTGEDLSRKYRPGVQRLLLRLIQNRQKMQTQVQAEMDTLQESGVIEEINAYLQPRLDSYDKSHPHSPKLYQLAHKRISKKVESLFSYELYIHNVDRVKELHAMRIVAKQVRYSLEAFTPIYGKDFKQYVQAVISIQDLLGAIHDCDVWIEYLPVFIEEERQRNQEFFGHTKPIQMLLPGFEYFTHNRIQERQQLYEAFLIKWDQLLKEDCMWDKLLQTILPDVPQTAQPGAQPDESTEQAVTESEPIDRISITLEDEDSMSPIPDEGLAFEPETQPPFENQNPLDEISD